MYLQRTRSRDIIYELAIELIEELIKNESFEIDRWREKIIKKLHLKKLTDEQLINIYDLSEYVLHNDVQNEFNNYSDDLEKSLKVIDGIEVFEEIINSEAKLRGFFIWTAAIDPYFNEDEIFEIGGHKFAFAKSRFPNGTLSIIILSIGKESKSFYEHCVFSKNIAQLHVEDSVKKEISQKNEIIVDIHINERFAKEFIKKYGNGDTRKLIDKYNTEYLLIELKDISKMRDMQYLY